MAIFNHLVPVSPLQTTPLKWLQRVCAHKERLQNQPLHWLLAGLCCRAQQIRAAFAQQPHSGMGVKRKVIQNPLRIFYSKQEKEENTACFLWHCPPSHFEPGLPSAKEKKQTKKLILGEKKLVMMLCSMFLKASVVRVRNPGWSQHPQNSLETLPSFRVCQVRLESKQTARVRKLC